jgi:hypothetical protein
MDGVSINTVCYALEGNSHDQGQIPQVEYKVSRHWAANNDVSLREALREQYVRSEWQWSDGGQLCWQVITFEWVLKEEDGEMVVVPTLPDIKMLSRHTMGLSDPPSYMRFNTDRLVELYPPNEPMPDWLFAGMGVLGSKHLQTYMRKRNERYGILVRWTGGWTHLKCNWLTGNTFSLYSRSRRRHFMNGVFHTMNPALCQAELRHRLRRIIA